MFMWACLKAPDYSKVPYIEFKSFSKSQLIQDQFNTDSLLITLHFTDGDGDIGTSEGNFDMFITDTRDNFMPPAYRLPRVPDLGSGNGVSGEIFFVIYTTCCLYPDGQDPCTKNPNYPTDTLSYAIYLKDRAGNKSNVITTPPIVLICD